MNETFSFQRFGKYYKTELQALFNNTWITVLLTALAGLIAYLFCGIMNLIIGGSWDSYGLVGRWCTFLATFFVLTLSLPSKAYGYFTEKRAGTLYTLIPVSQLEKTLSMLLNVCIVAPVAFILLAFSADALLCLCDPRCGETLIYSLANGLQGMTEFFEEGSNPNLMHTGDIIFIVCQSAATYFLYFLLGSLYFKKHKIGKTILVYIAAGLVFSLIVAPFSHLITEMDWKRWYETPEEAVRVFKTVTYSIGIVGLLLLSGWTYLRIKTVKH